MSLAVRDITGKKTLTDLKQAVLNHKKNENLTSSVASMVEGKFSTTNNIPINNWKIPLLLLVARMIIVDWCPISVSTQYCKTWQEVCFSIKSFQERICYNNIYWLWQITSTKMFSLCFYQISQGRPSRSCSSISWSGTWWNNFITNKTDFVDGVHYNRYFYSDSKAPAL